MAVRAVTFDLWDTLVNDDSDEPKRKERGLRSKKDERRHQVWAALHAIEPIERDRVDLAYDTAEAGFNLVWRECHINWTVEQRLQVVLRGLKRTVADEVFARLVEGHSRMEVDIPPDPVDGVQSALAELAERYRLCVVSDSIVTPGTGLRAILERHDLKRYFSGFVFSDEVGHSKPHRAMFDAAARQLGVSLEEIVHIGDRDHNDVRGAHAVGAKAVLFTAARADDKESTAADAVCEHHRDLPAIIDRLARG
jgi:putative hydrolase of the HAD superfamily